MLIRLSILLFFTSSIEAQLRFDSKPRQLCRYPSLENGRPRLRQRWKMVRFSCSVGFELVGNRYATCRNGEWDVPIPVCVRNGCPIPSVEKGIVMLAHHEAWLHAFCLPGYTLKGSSTLYCNGIHWNGTVPECVGSNVKPKLSCNFEDPDLCGWTQDEFHDFDWKRLNKQTPSSFLFTGPSYDHTYGPGINSGFYMYIESTSRQENDTARLLSPIYDADVANDACFVFYYHMFGADIGGLRVYQKPDSVSLYNTSTVYLKKYLLFELWGNHNDIWYGSVTPLKNYSEPFQIVIEGIRGTGITSDIAIDDVAIMYGENCTEALKHITTPTPPIPTSCVGRCDMAMVLNYSELTVGCSCNIMCIYDSSCCLDFLDQCVYNAANSKVDDDDTTPYSKTTPELPQTQKLVGVNITKISITSTTLPPTTSPQTTSTKSRTKYDRPTTRQTTKHVLSTKAITRPTTRTSTATTSKPTKPTTTTSTTTKPKPTKTIPSTITTTTPKATITTSTTFTTTVTQIVVANITRKPITDSKMTSTIYYKKDAISDVSVTRDLKSSKVVKEIPKKSGWEPISILVSAICIGCFCGLMYAVVALRSTRGRMYIARIRGTVRQDPEVRYLNTDVDID